MFSVRGLLLAMTLFCVIAGYWAMHKGEEGIAYGLTIAALMPAAVVCLALVSFSRHRWAVLIATITGAFFGFVEGIPMHGGPAMTAWEAVPRLFVPMAISTAIGAVLFGGVALFFDRGPSSAP